ncbi:WD repeat-containing protein 44 [Mytilus galloprovincialis]|uniref:WD repeat-containing protein 44 n=2 Tax=Mytilus galloprovincialis TaxID=29158 RepID=A0A8B6G767_MYTGA|nr:WD repeat-containing protein 44 [Mytilus galloprovincialis]
MSSDSELEEFYDAEEATPKRYVQKNSLKDALEKFSECVTDSEESGDEADSGILNNVKSVDEEEKWMTVHSDKFRISRPDELDGVAEKWTTIRNQPDKSDQSDDSDEKVVIPNRPERADSILEEEARLKEIRRIQEDRRKKEDAEFQNQLEELKRKKREKEMIEEKRRKENEKRRRKLEQMRRRVSDGSDHILVDSKEDSDSDVSQESTKDPVSIKLTVYTDNINVSIPDINSANLVTSLCEAGLPATLQANITIPDTKTSRSSSMRGDSNRQDRPILHANLVVQEPLRSRSNSSINSSASEGPAVTGRRIPESDTIVNEVIVASNEPDIIRITKTRTPPSTLQYPSAPHNTLTFPVAPPRKKKCSSSELSDSPSEWSNRTSLTLPTPTSTVDKLTRDLEFTLDLQSALGGGRHIRTEDVDGHAINSDKPRFFKSDDRLKISSDSESSPSSNLQVYRPRSNSGRLLTDQEILDAVMVVNLDTGEEVPLSVAEDKIPKGMNPLSLHIMRLTKEYRDHAGDTESIDGDMMSETMSLSEENGSKKKKSRLRKMLGKKIDRTTNRLKSVADQVLHMEETAVEQEIIFDGKMFKIKAKTSKMQHDFDKLQLLQDMTGVHTGAVWIMKFSPCGRLLATGGQDNTLRIWVLKSAFTYFNDMKQKYADVTISPAPSQESLNSFLSGSSGELLEQASGGHDPEDLIAPFMPKPFCTFRGHTADVLDVSWSKNHFILSSSMDKTVRLWHVSRKECLCTFQHIDFVTSIVFHPKDDRYFLSGSLDGKLRLWNIPDKKVTLWNEVQGPSALITTANFCRNGKLAVVGTYDGKCIFYTTEQLKYHTQIHVRSTRGKNAKGSKITGIEPLPGEDKVLVTSNDSRIRLYDLRDKMLTCKYKGCANNSSQIKASFSPKAKYIICGSEDQFVYIWKQNHDFYKFSSARRDRNDYWEAIKIHNAVVTAAIFAPKPSLLKPNNKKKYADDSDEDEGEVMVTADFTGALKVVRNLKGTMH